MKLLNHLLQNQKRLDCASQLTTNFLIALSYFVSAGIIALLLFLTGCKKDKDKGIDFTTTYNKKWQRVSGIAEPLWTYPATGKSYPDLNVFEKEVFPCVTDNYVVNYPNGTTIEFRNTERCYAGEPDAAPTGTYTFDARTDSFILTVPFEVPGQPPTTSVIRSKVLELTEDKMVMRFVQILPFTNTPHTITSTLRVIP